jgi:hypothetical protein
VPPATTCPHCGAKLRKRYQANCTYCGSRLEVESVDAPGTSGPADHGARLALLKAHPRYPELLEHEPELGRHVLGGGCAVLFLTVWTLMAGGFAVMGGGTLVSEGLFGLPFLLIPGFMAAVGVAGLVHLVRKLQRFKSAPWRRVPAVVLGTRTRNTSDSSRSYLTLEFEDGERQEFPAEAKTTGTLTEGDVGVAYLRSDHLVDFERVRV